LTCPSAACRTSTSCTSVPTGCNTCP
jgi:hypothetical protein